jgi:N-acetylmuramoyl-L-alanine amidase
MNLRESIAWANEKAPELNDGLAVDIHLNYLSNTSARGSEAFHGTSDTSMLIAKALTDSVSKKMGIPNRGAKPDTQTAVGSLGWIRKTTMWASLIEVCFLTNAEDMEALRGSIGGTDGYVDAAMGIANGIDKVFGVEVKKPKTPNPLAKYTVSQLFAEISRRILGLRA